MGSIEDIGGWVTIAAAGLVLLALLVGTALTVRFVTRSRRARESQYAELADALERLRDSFREDREARARAEREADDARQEASRLRELQEVASGPDLETVLEHALASASAAAGAPAAMISVESEEGRPYIATSGLSEEEASRPLIRLPSRHDPARAATIEYTYTEEEVENDVFRLRGGVVVPLRRRGAPPIGTLAVFWRRHEQSSLEHKIDVLEDLASVLVPALDNARRLDEATRESEVDPVTNLPNRRAFRTRLVAECARARRYGRRLSLVAIALPGEDLRSAAEQLRRAIRAGDLAAHLGGGTCAVLLPEAAQGDAQPFLQRIRFLFGVVEPADVPASVVELAPDDDPTTFLKRAEHGLERILPTPADEQNAGVGGTVF